MDALRVLLIEKNSKESERISSVLAGANHDVVPASGFEDASEALRIQKFDAVLVGSWAAPDGVAAFANNLRALERNQRNAGRTAVLSCSPQLPQGSNWSPAVDAPIDGYLPPQFEAATFSDAVNTLARAVARHPDSQARSASSELPILDSEQLHAQVAHDRELLVEIIDLFLAERGDQITEMRSALSAADYNRLSRAAHTVKGSLASLHAPQAKARAQELELAARNHEDQVCRFSLAQLEQDLDILEVCLLSLREASS